MSEAIIYATLSELGVKASKDGAKIKIGLAVDVSTALLALMPQVGQSFKVLFRGTQASFDDESEKQQVVSLRDLLVESLPYVALEANRVEKPEQFNYFTVDTIDEATAICTQATVDGSPSASYYKVDDGLHFEVKVEVPGWEELPYADVNPSAVTLRDRIRTALGLTNQLILDEAPFDELAKEDANALDAGVVKALEEGAELVAGFKEAAAGLIASREAEAIAKEAAVTELPDSDTTIEAANQEVNSDIEAAPDSDSWRTRLEDAPPPIEQAADSVRVVTVDETDAFLDELGRKRVTEEAHEARVAGGRRRR